MASALVAIAVGPGTTVSRGAAPATTAAQQLKIATERAAMDFLNRMKSQSSEDMAHRALYTSLMLSGVDGRPLRSGRRFHLNGSHHAAVFVLQDVAVIDERPGDCGVAEVHAQPNTGIGPLTV